MAVSARALKRYGKPVAFLLLSLPAAGLVTNWVLAFAGEPHGLGFNPHETSNRFSGDWALRILLGGLALTPLANALGTQKPILFRRMMGLFAFFYVLLHIVSYVWLDLLLDWTALWQDIVKRTYITVGMAAAVALVPLAWTSTSGWVKKLGARRWKRLHRLVYLIVPLALLHFYMMRKGIQAEPLIYAAIFAGLMLLRLPAVRGLFRRAQNRKRSVGLSRP